MICSTDGVKHKAGTEIQDGIEVHYVINPYSNYMSAPRKVWAFVRFIALAIKKVLGRGGYQLLRGRSGDNGGV